MRLFFAGEAHPLPVDAVARGFDNIPMEPSGEGAILVTGAGGQVGAEVCRTLKASGRKALATDVTADPAQPEVACDLRRREQVAALFGSHPVQAVIHLAAVLPSAFLADPLRGAEVNLVGSCHLLEAAVQHAVKRFVFASSMSVYGSMARSRPLHEGDAVAPDEPYGACKRAVECVGETLSARAALEFVALRMARVVGPGARNTSSLWRSQIFDGANQDQEVVLPFAADALLSLVHVQDLARMLIALAEAPELARSVYNTPAELWQAKQLQEAVQKATPIRVRLTTGGTNPGPTCDGRLLAKEFGFQTVGLRERLQAAWKYSTATPGEPPG